MVDTFIKTTGNLDGYTGPQVEILPDMWLGNEDNGANFDGEWIAVHGECNHSKARRIPVMESSLLGYDTTTASKEALDAATSLMRSFQKQGRRQILTCAMGIERSPLTFCYFLVRYKYVATWDEAYKLLEQKRPVVERRMHWLPSKKMQHGQVR